MKKSRYFPFERNRYFYGKLLTVRDFESEQKYFNDKRRLLNRLLHGSGVVSGLQVVAVDDKSVSVEMGVALDDLGREIVAAAPVTMKLSMIDGFTNNEYGKNVYLCVAYDEKGKEPVHSVANSTVRQDEVSEYNRMLETYRLFIKEEAPEPSANSFSHLLEDTTVLYRDSKVRVVQKAPRYVNPDEIFEMTLVVEKTLQTSRISLEYELDADRFTQPDGKSLPRISFSEPNDSRESEYEVKFLVRAGSEAADHSMLQVRGGRLFAGDRELPLEPGAANRIGIIKEPVKQRILEDYFNRSLDQALDASGDHSICLAKISLLQMGPTYVIEKVEPVPFNEYVYNDSLLFRLGMQERKASGDKFWATGATVSLAEDESPAFGVEFNESNNHFHFKLGLPKARKLTDEIATGVVEIALEANAKSFFSKGEKTYVTDEIPHGLGSGHIFVETALEEEPDEGSELAQGGERTYFGDADVFADTQHESHYRKVSVGALVYPRKGTLRIGIRSHNVSDGSVVRVRWWAFKKKEQTGLRPAASSMLEAAAGSHEV